MIEQKVGTLRGGLESAEKNAQIKEVIIGLTVILI